MILLYIICVKIYCFLLPVVWYHRFTILYLPTYLYKCIYYLHLKKAINLRNYCAIVECIIDGLDGGLEFEQGRPSAFREFNE